jgi:hypothetical protein
MPEEPIRTIEMVRRIRNAHYERVKDLRPQEKIAFFREKARKLHDELGRSETFLSSPTASKGVRRSS